MLSKCLRAGRIIRAAIFLSPFMCGHMASKSCASGKFLSTTFPVAHVVPNFSVGALDVMIKVRITQEVFIAPVMRAFINSVVGMGAEMVFEARRAIECLVAAAMGALKCLQL
jgi:hypothetical protein